MTRCVALTCLWALWLPQLALGQRGQFDRAEVKPADEALIVTPPGFSKPGKITAPPSAGAAVLNVTVVDRATGAPTPCRVNVVGTDGNFYHPAENRLAEFSLRGNWPDAGQGNRPAKSPIRYFGHFFYCTGQFSVAVPAGELRIEVAKGFEFAPLSETVVVKAGEAKDLSMEIARTLDAAAQGYWSGDPHLHFPRSDDESDARIFDLLDAEDIRFGVVMCYNETDTYTGAMSKLVMPQWRGLGRRSIASRGARHIISGQEYRNAVYGHLNLFLRGDLVAPGATYDPNRWPVFGIVGRETQAMGGYAIHAHGGYAQEIYADLVQRATNGVELLQFGIYRGIGLENWYRILNCGFQFPAVGASDYPACRKLGDCQTYVAHSGEPTIEAWLAGLAAGRSFVTTGPLVYLDVDGKKPGDTIALTGDAPEKLTARVSVPRETAPGATLQLIVGGKVVREQPVGENDLTLALEIGEPTWIAARVFYQARTGSPDGEAHTNPVYVHRNGRAPYREADLDWLAGEIQAQLAAHEQRAFAEREHVVAYFRESLDILEKIRAQKGQVAHVELKPAVEAALTEPLLPAEQPLAEVKAFIDPRVAELPGFKTAAEWNDYAQKLRGRLLDEIVFRGAAAEWRTAQARVEWLDTMEGFAGYRIRKLRYEALPGMWIPALLYEPTKVTGLMPVVLNINGHDPVGKSAKDEQIRSINCAKRGMLALHPEWLGMGQLRTDGFAHGRMNQLDLCGASGLAPFYLSLSRALDVLCAHPQADPARVAVTGLSGGGWQTAWISALDERVTLANPVAGYTSLRIAIAEGDMGDSEQAPCDFGALADGLHLTALRAPRATLLTYNAADDCCFKSAHTLAPLMAAARPMYALLGASDQLESHENKVPGTHNYERDNRQAFYAAARRTFFPEQPPQFAEEIACDDELQTAAALEVPLPAKNRDFTQLAQDLAKNLPNNAEPAAGRSADDWKQQRRQRLFELLRMERHDVEAMLHATTRSGPLTIRRWLLKVGRDWTVPVVEFETASTASTGKASATPLLFVADRGFAVLAEQVQAALATGRRVFVADLFLMGQSQITGSDPQVYFAIAAASVGARPLGIQASQLASMARWIRSQSDAGIEISAQGRRATTAASIAAAVEPAAIARLTLADQLTSFKQLLDENRAIEEFAELFPFGLLAEFDLEEIRELASQ